MQYSQNLSLKATLYFEATLNILWQFKTHVTSDLRPAAFCGQFHSAKGLASRDKFDHNLLEEKLNVHDTNLTSLPLPSINNNIYK